MNRASRRRLAKNINKKSNKDYKTMFFRSLLSEYRWTKDKEINLFGEAGDLKDKVNSIFCPTSLNTIAMRAPSINSKMNFESAISLAIQVCLE